MCGWTDGQRQTDTQTHRQIHAVIPKAITYRQIFRWMYGCKDRISRHTPTPIDLDRWTCTTHIRHFLTIVFQDGFITLEEYKSWATTESLSRLVLDILFQVTPQASFSSLLSSATLQLNCLVAIVCYFRFVILFLD